MHSIEKIKKALQSLIDAAFGDAKAFTVSIPARPNEDADLVVSAAIRELEAARAALVKIANLLPPTLPAPLPDLPPAWDADQRALYAAVETARAAKGGR